MTSITPVFPDVLNGHVEYSQVLTIGILLMLTHMLVSPLINGEVVRMWNLELWLCGLTKYMLHKLYKDRKTLSISLTIIVICSVRTLKPKKN